VERRRRPGEDPRHACWSSSSFTERTLQPSATVRYTVRQAGTPGTAADPCAGTKVDDIVIGGVAVDPTATYRITVG
jgi:5'-nucleotidase